MKKRVLFLVFVLLMATGFAVHWVMNTGKESTDDAIIEAHTIPISPKVSGYIVALNVRDNQQVKKGDVLVEIDPRDYALRLDAAKARLVSAQVEANNAGVNARRAIAIGKAAGAQKDIDNAVAAEATAKAAEDAARVEVAIAQKNLDDSKIIAPEDGVITMRNAEQGGYATPGQQLFMLVGMERWVVANFKEVQITHMRPGQRVDIVVDAYPKLKLNGKVDSIQSGTGARFSAFPPENATGNFVKIVQRVPVKIILDGPVPEGIVLGPGLSVQPVVFIDDRSRS